MFSNHSGTKESLLGLVGPAPSNLSDGTSLSLPQALPLNLTP